MRLLLVLDFIGAFWIGREPFVNNGLWSYLDLAWLEVYDYAATLCGS